MKNTLPISVVIMCSLVAPLNSFSQLSVTANSIANDLAQKLVGPGVTVTNATLVSYGTGVGTFVEVNTNLGLDSGVLLTTGKVSYALGPNSSGSSGGNNGGAGDAELSALSGFTTKNACVLEFDVSNATDTLQLKYVFASEEYNDFVINLYNDIFAFFISGPGYSSPQNIANLPGTSIPVSIGNVNCGNNPQYYVCNDPWNPYAGYCTTQCPTSAAGTLIGYDGFTTPLVAKAVIQPCQTYHLKLAIADAVDGLYDSGVFLKAGSLVSAGNCITLPIQLTNFDVKQEKENAVLSWNTASEYNSSYFAIERSSDGKYFDEVGKLTAAGQSALPSSYSFIDKNITEFANGKIYYRLRMVDRDLSYQYSEVREIEVLLSGSVGDIAKIYPNPFSNSITVQFADPSCSAGSIQIIHPSGKVIFDQPFNKDNALSLTIDELPQSASGLYFIRITSGDYVFTDKLFKKL